MEKQVVEWYYCGFNFPSLIVRINDPKKKTSKSRIFPVISRKSWKESSLKFISDFSLALASSRLTFGAYFSPVGRWQEFFCLFFLGGGGEQGEPRKIIEKCWHPKNRYWSRSIVLFFFKDHFGGKIFGWAEAHSGPPQFRHCCWSQ